MRLAVALGTVALLALSGCAMAHAPDGIDKLVLSDVVPGAIVTQPFGCTELVLEQFDPACPGRHFHSGVDLAAAAGTAVHAASGGRARVIFDAAGAGLYVVVTGDDGSHVLYCHLSAVHVADGEEVSAGQVIGEVGSTGLSTGAHLHFEVDVDGKAVDPVLWLAS